jgi:hypothetical protein
MSAGGTRLVKVNTAFDRTPSHRGSVNARITKPSEFVLSKGLQQMV